MDHAQFKFITAQLDAIFKVMAVQVTLTSLTLTNGSPEEKNEIAEEATASIAQLVANYARKTGQEFPVDG
jgi:hypothetical protein